jgi:hypothetical protein
MTAHISDSLGAPGAGSAGRALRSPRRGEGEPGETLLEVEGLSVHLPTGPRSEVHAVRKVDLEVKHGERVGIVGESGSGKSVTGRAIAGLLPPSPRVRTAGRIVVGGRSLLDAPERAWQEVRSRQIGLVFQDPLTYLNPVMKVGRQLREGGGPPRAGRPPPPTPRPGPPRGRPPHAAAGGAETAPHAAAASRTQTRPTDAVRTDRAISGSP